MSAGIVIVGGGQAAAAATAKIRELDKDVPVTMVCGEAVLPYQRPPLSKKYLSGEMPLDRVILRPQQWYDENGVNVRLGVTAKAIRANEQKIVLSDDTQIPYDKLLLATGSHPRRLPDTMGGKLKGVHYLRSTLDSNALRPSLLPGVKVVVVGGGYIGLEVASVAAQMGLDVTIVEMADRILQRVACPETSNFYRNLHEKHGVTILESTAFQSCRQRRGCPRRGLANGTALPTDWRIGRNRCVANNCTREEAGRAVENGISVDENCRTSSLDIFAAGDCTGFPFKGGRIRLESVPHAIHQAEAAVQNILGRQVSYEAEPWFWSDQYDVKLQIAGLNSGYTQTIVRPDGAKGRSRSGILKVTNCLRWTQ